MSSWTLLQDHSAQSKGLQAELDSHPDMIYIHLHIYIYIHMYIYMHSVNGLAGPDSHGWFTRDHGRNVQLHVQIYKWQNVGVSCSRFGPPKMTQWFQPFGFHLETTSKGTNPRKTDPYTCIWVGHTCNCHIFSEPCHFRS